MLLSNKHPHLTYLRYLQHICDSPLIGDNEPWVFTVTVSTGLILHYVFAFELLIQQRCVCINIHYI